MTTIEGIITDEDEGQTRVELSTGTTILIEGDGIVLTNEHKDIRLLGAGYIEPAKGNDGYFIHEVEIL